MLEKSITYIADLDQDIDDYIAILYLNSLGVLKDFICDPEPDRFSDDMGWRYKHSLIERGIPNRYWNISPETKYIFSGGGLNKVLMHLKDGNTIDTLVMNGGFAGTNIVTPENELAKFKGKEYMRTYNFNLNVKETDKFLRQPKSLVHNTILVGKNVCHNQINTKQYLWNLDFLKEEPLCYMVKESKLLHDVLACHEGLAFLDPEHFNNFCTFEKLYPKYEELNGSMTKWGTTTKREKYRQCLIATGFTKEIKEKYKGE